jgi:hypothetical protein
MSARGFPHFPPDGKPAPLSALVFVHKEFLVKFIFKEYSLSTRD